jgi:hypothetical protein
MSVPGRERPLCVTSVARSKSVTTTLRVNEEGGEQLIIALRCMIDEGRPIRFPIYMNGSWGWMEVRRSSQSDFTTDGKPCKCGCQDEFVEIESKYREAGRTQ